MRKRNISPERLIEAIKEYIDGKGSFNTIAEKYCIAYETIRNAYERYKGNGISTFIETKHNAVYAEELKEKAVMEYLQGEGSQTAIAAKYGLRSKSQLQQWIKAYNSGRGFQRKKTGGSRMKEARSTTLEERVQIARDCIANGGNYGETALKYNVSYQQVYQWTRKFKEMGAAGLEDRRGRRKKDQTPRTELEKAQIEIERLKHELYMTQMERDLLKKLDEIERREAYRK
jgi:transposase-like protein